MKKMKHKQFTKLIK